jgi:hypothetical protein
MAGEQAEMEQGTLHEPRTCAARFQSCHRRAELQLADFQIGVA